MSSRPKCIACGKELDFEVSEADRIIDDNIYYCDECFEAIEREWEDDHDQNDR